MYPKICNVFYGVRDCLRDFLGDKGGLVKDQTFYVFFLQNPSLRDSILNSCDIFL